MSRPPARPARQRPDERRLPIRVLSWLVLPILAAMTKPRYEGLEHLPKTGPYILVANHVSKIDPLILARFVWWTRRAPCFLAKAELFKIPVVGRVLTGIGQIPVYRHSSGSDSLRAAKEALAQGRTVMIYPEGTLTKDPDLWPMRGKTGAVRLALETGAPLIPVAQWGAQELLGNYGRRLRPFPRKTVRVRVGEPLALQDIHPGHADSAELREATDRMMSAITSELEQLRGPKMKDEK